MSSAQPLLFIVSGPSGAGKGTFIEHVVRDSPVRRVPTFTTRAARPGEQAGVDYEYIGDDDFWARVESGEIFEYTRTYGDFVYGSPSRLIELEPSPLIAELDYKGMFRVRAQSPRRVVSVFVMTPDWQTATDRITTRSEESNLDARRAKWQEQVQFAWAYDYVVQNGKLDRFLAKAEAIAEAELLRRAGAQLLLDRRAAFDDTLE